MMFSMFSDKPGDKRKEIVEEPLIIKSLKEAPNISTVCSY